MHVPQGLAPRPCGGRLRAWGGPTALRAGRFAAKNQDVDHIDASGTTPPHDTDAKPRPIVLVGLMGAGKTTVGARIASALGRRFVDSDSEIEAAAKMSVPEIFEHYGETEFRALERRVVARLLSEAPAVIATGGGAFIDPDTRALMKEQAITVWLKADLDVLMRRVGRRGGRPLLEVEDPRAVMERLMAERYPVYAEADITVESVDGPHDATVKRVIEALEARPDGAGSRPA